MNTDIIESYHTHIYFDASTRPAAEALRTEMENLFPKAVYGRWHDRHVGPHPSSMFQIAFGTDLFASLVPWLALKHGPLTVFLHPNTGKALTDHAERAIWMGRQRQLNLGVLSDGKK